MTVIKPNTFKTISLLRIYKTTSASGRPHFARVNKFATTNFCDLINPDQFCYHNYTKTTGSRRNNIRNDKVLANLATISRKQNKGYSIPTFWGIQFIGFESSITLLIFSIYFFLSSNTYYFTNVLSGTLIIIIFPITEWI